MKLIVGLGNPGSRYQKTRHNVGFKIVDGIAKKFQKKFKKNLFSKSEVASFSYEGEEVILAKPLTYMNLSGHAIRRLVLGSLIHVHSDVLVVMDDVDLGLGKLRFRPSGSSGGHRGFSSVIDTLGTNIVARLRVGIGRPTAKKTSVSDFVLKPFSTKENGAVKEIVEKSQAACLLWVTSGPGAVMQQYNS